jgi:hypothetical protein
MTDFPARQAAAVSHSPRAVFPTPERAPMVEQINFAAFNCVGWWFGDRMARKSK